MSFSYNNGANPPIDYPRLLIADTVDAGHIFDDGEIMAAYAINTRSAWQSSQTYSGPAGRFPSGAPTNYLRAAALLLNSIAANKSRLSSIIQLLDVKLDPSKAAGALRDQAQAYLDMDDNSGAFFIAEQVTTVFNFYDRFWSQWLRQSGGS